MNRGHFPGFRTPSSDFAAVKTDLQTALLWDELDLSSARSLALNTHAEKSYAGNSIYIDKKTDVGNATIIFQNDDGVKPPRVFVEPGFIARVPWTRLIIENDAQPGKVLRLFYGVDVDFVPGTSAGVQITGTVDVEEQGTLYGASFASSAAQAANTALQVFAPGANVNGAILHDAGMYIQGSAATERAALLAKTSAPTTITDGDVFLASIESTSLSTKVPQFRGPQRIAAGKGLYFFNDVLENLVYKWAKYTLL